MFPTLKRLALAAGVSLVSLMSYSAAVSAQDVTFVLSANEVGVPTYNPPKASNTNEVYYLLYDRLVELDATKGYHPHLAESWEEAPDGMSWVFHLKKGVTFHNGEPFNAETVAAWIPLYANTDNAYMIDAIDKVEVVDEYTAKFVMKRPEPNLLYNLASTFMGVVEPKAYAAMGEDYGVTDAVGTGPFKFESFTVGQETTLTRNDDYTWGSELAVNAGPAKFDHAVFREIPEDSTAFLELKTGGVDMLLGIPTDYLGEVAKEPSLAVLTLPGQELSYFVMNVTKAPFDDIKVREAAAKAINQKEIVDNIYGGVGQAADTFLISALAESKVAPQYKISYDPDRANKLLDEAGWVMGADGVRAKDGQPLHIELWTQSDSSFRRLTEVVQAQLKAVGIDATITTFDSSTIRDEYKKDVHQAAVRSYFWDNADIIDWFFGADRAGYPNISMLNDPKAEELREKALKGSKNGAERIANFTAYHEYILSLFPFSPIYQPVVSVGYNKDRLKLIDNSNLSSFQQESILGLEVLN
jgi:peptide/nickel transport system substrate-binding protein